MAAFSKRGYIIVAGALATAYKDAASSDFAGARGFMDDVLRAASGIANAFEADNPAFDRDHFLAVVRGERDVNSRPPSSRVRRDHAA